MANNNIYTLCEVIYDRRGKKHKIYPCPILHLDTVTKFLAKTNYDFIFANFLVSDMDETNTVMRDEVTGEYIRGHKFLDELLDVVEIALDFKESREDITQWLDISMAKEIVETLIGMSQLKKKTEETEQAEK